MNNTHHKSRPPPQRILHSHTFQTSIRNERKHNARNALRRPHNTQRQALSLHEPFIQIERRRAEQEAVPNGA